MRATAVLEEIRSRGIELKAVGGKLYAKPSIPADLLPEIREHKQEVLGTLTKTEERERIHDAFILLYLGETPFVRLLSGTCGGEMLIVKDEQALEELAITIDCPTFTLKELQSLAASKASEDMLVKIFTAKKVFPEATVEPHSAKRRAFSTKIGGD